MDMTTSLGTRGDHHQAGGNSWWEETRAMLVLGWPLVLTSLAQVLMNATDVLFIGRVGPQALAAAALGTNLYIAAFVVGLGLGIATSAMLAQTLGRSRHAVRDVRRTVRQALWICFFAVIPVWVVLWQAEAILLRIGQAPDLAAEAARFVRILQWGMLPVWIFMVLRSFCAALERVHPPMLVTILAIGLNALLNWLLVFGHFGLPALGLQGSALATLISSVFMALTLLAYILFDRHLRRFSILGRFWRADWPRLRELALLAVPIIVTLAFEMLVFNVAVMLMGLIGKDELAAHSIAIQMAALTFMVPVGLSQAAVVRVGLAAGRGDMVGVARAGWVAIGLGVVFMSCTALLFVTMPSLIVRLFLGEITEDKIAVARHAAVFLGIAGIFQIVDGIQCLASGVLRGLKDATIPMVIAAIGYWVIGLPVGAWLAFYGGMGGAGIWVGLAVGLGSVAVMMLLRWSWRDRLGLLTPYRHTQAG